MAIVVEEEKSASAGWGTIAVWAILIAILGVSVYYVFFRRPDLVEVATPANFQDAVEISKIKLDPSAVINSAQFKALQSYANPLSTESSGGRTNPFLGTF